MESLLISEFIYYPTNPQDRPGFRDLPHFLPVVHISRSFGNNYCGCDHIVPVWSEQTLGNESDALGSVREENYLGKGFEVKNSRGEPKSPTIPGRC